MLLGYRPNNLITGWDIDVKIPKVNAGVKNKVGAIINNN